MPQTPISVLIVGAGPTGLTLACDLARRGVTCRIIDKAQEYFAGSRGKGLQPRSLEVFDDFGIVGRVLSQGRFHMPIRAYEAEAVLSDFDPHEGRHPTPDVPYASTLIIPQFRVEENLRMLLEELGAHVELATELVALEQNEECVTATLQNGASQELVRSTFLVAADGGRSFVRKFLNVGFEGETWKDERMFVGDVRVDGMDRDHWHAWPKHSDGWVTLCPLPSTESFQFQAQVPAQEEGPPSIEAFQHILEKRSGRSDLKLYGATWLSLYKANVRMIDRYRIGRVFLAGDAAHVHSPAGGQGMNTGIQDAYNLGWKLGAVLNGARHSLLNTYEEERLPVAASLLGITTRLHRQFSSGNPNPMRRGPETLQLELNYRQSSLSRECSAPAGSLLPGDRAPDSHLLSGRLFDVLRGPRWTLLAPSVDAGLEYVAERNPSHLQIFDKTVVDDQYNPDTYYLIRPDGYIGLTGNSQSGAKIEAYLDEIYNAT